MPSSAAKRILVTRSRHQASTLAAHLQALGAEPILIPTISIAPPESFAALDAALNQLRTFDWLLFTSANAVDAFHHRLRTFTNLFATPKIAAIGPATAAALNRIHLNPDLIPPRPLAEDLAQALLPHITPNRTRILLIRAEAARNVLPDTLLAAGADLTIAPAYRNLIPQASIPRLQFLFASPANWPDAITFTSSSTAVNLLSLLGAAGIVLPADNTAGQTILRASIGPITSQTLRSLGLPPHLESPEANIPSLVQTLATKLHLPPAPPR